VLEECENTPLEISYVRFRFATAPFTVQVESMVIVLVRRRDESQLTSMVYLTLVFTDSCHGNE